MAEIFISYAREDRHKAQQLAQALEAQGWSVWWDVVIPAGSTFDEVIDAALEDAKCVIVMWSHASVASRYVRGEAQDADERKKLVPVLVERGVRIPRAFRAIQAADLVGWDGTAGASLFLRLVDDVAGLLGPPPIVKAAEQASRHPEATEAKREARTEEKRNVKEEPIRRIVETKPSRKTDLALVRLLILALSSLILLVVGQAVGQAVVKKYRAERKFRELHILSQLGISSVDAGIVSSADAGEAANKSMSILGIWQQTKPTGYRTALLFSADGAVEMASLNEDGSSGTVEKGAFAFDGQTLTLRFRDKVLLDEHGAPAETAEETLVEDYGVQMPDEHTLILTKMSDGKSDGKFEFRRRVTSFRPRTK